MSKVDIDAPLMPDVDLSTAAGQAQAVTFYHDAVQGLNASGKNQRLPVADLTINPDNPREEYDVDGMIASFRHRGFVIGAPITISKRADGVNMVLRGNRRVSAAQKFATVDPEGFKKVFPDGKIPCLVLTDLSRAEETTVLIDHGKEQDRRKLSAREELRAIRQLMKAGIKGRDAIARALDLITVSKDDKGVETEKVRSSYVQPRLNLLALPEAVQVKYIGESSMFGGKNAVLKQQTIAPLYTALSNDRKAGNIGQDGFGPELRAAWDTLLATPTTPASDAPVKYIADSKCKALLQECDSAALTNALTYFGGYSKTLKLSEIDSACQAAEQAQVMLAHIADFVGPDEFASLCEKADSAARAKADALKASAGPADGTEKVESTEKVEVNA